MKKKNEKILGIRPFNMANFSGGSGYMPIMSILGAVVSLPATLFIGMGMASSSKTGDGKLDYQILKRRLNRIALPICLVMFFFFALAGVDSVYGDIWAYIPACLWGAAFPTVGIYLALSLSAKVLSSGSNLSTGMWLVLSIVFIVLIAVLGLSVLLGVLEPLGDEISQPHILPL